jgi:hypothetical protein
MKHITIATRRLLALNRRSKQSKHNLERPDRNRILWPTLPTDGKQQSALISPPIPKEVFLRKHGKTGKSRGKMGWWSNSKRVMTWMPWGGWRWGGYWAGWKVLLRSYPNRKHSSEPTGFITMNTKICHWTLSWASSQIHSLYLLYIL